MGYILRKVTDNAPEIEVSEEDYLAYKQATRVLANCLAMEGKYEILISNYVDMEKQVVDIATTHMLRNRVDYSDFFDIRVALNIRLVNVLTSARLYVDQLHKHVERCVPNIRNAKEIVKALFSKEYDENLEYRFMEVLRNYAQHSGIPVHVVTPCGKWTDAKLYECSVEFTAEKELLEQNGKFKPEVLKEIPDKIDLKRATRSYVESLSKVHSAAREMTQESVQKSRTMLEDAYHQYRKTCGKDSKLLIVCKIHDEKVIERVPLYLLWDDIRIKLQKRNPKLASLRRRFVTGKLEEL